MTDVTKNDMVLFFLLNSVFGFCDSLYLIYKKQQVFTLGKNQKITAFIILRSNFLNLTH